MILEHINRNIISGLLALVVFAHACTPDNTAADTEIAIPVSVKEITTGSIEQYINATGTAYAVQEALLTSEITGLYILQKNPKTGRPFALGDMVDEGQKIIRLEDEEFENNVMIESQEMNLEISKSEFEKQQSLYDKGGVTLRELKNSEREFINAQYAYENAKIQLAKMDIRSPFDGVIVNLPFYTQGTRVNANMDMVRIMNYRQLYLDINLAEKYYNAIETGQKVNITNYNLPNDTLPGRITQISPAIDATSRTFQCHVRIDNPAHKIRPGMFVRADIIAAHKDSVIVIPKEIILSRQRGKTVFVIERGAAMERVIETGLENNTQVEVISGLEVNQRLVTKGYETLQNRSKVKVVQ